MFNANTNMETIVLETKPIQFQIELKQNNWRAPKAHPNFVLSLRF